MKNKTPLLSAKGVTRVFKKGKVEIPALQGVNLDVYEGETLAVVGASGAGKSTLLHILGTLERPTEGKIFFDGKDLTLYNDSDLANFRNQNLGFVFQFHYLLQEFSALENVMMPALIAGFSKKEEAAKERAKALLDRVGLSHRLTHRPGELSGGEQQRVAVARALMNQPKLLLADELTGNLDRGNSENIRNLLLELNREFSVTVLIVTHDEKVAQSLERCVVLEDGKILDS